jgi:hypothetical protein
MSFETGYQSALDDLPLGFLRDVHRAESEAAKDLVSAEIGTDDDAAVSAVRLAACCVNWQLLDAAECLCDY